VKKNMIWMIIGGVLLAVLIVFLVLILGREKKGMELTPMEAGSDVILPSEGTGSENGSSDDLGYVSNNGVTELIATVETQEEADNIAALYGITLKSFRLGVAVYETTEDPHEVIKRGEENGWPLISLNHVYTISPIEQGFDEVSTIPESK